MRGRRGAGGMDELSAHAQVDAEGAAVVHDDGELLAMASEVPDLAAAEQRCAEGTGMFGDMNDVAPPDGDARHPSSGQCRFE